MNFSSFSDIVVMPYKAHIVSAWYHLCIISQHFYIKRKKDRHIHENRKRPGTGQRSFSGSETGHSHDGSPVCKRTLQHHRPHVHRAHSGIRRSGPGGSRHLRSHRHPPFLLRYPGGAGRFHPDVHPHGREKYEKSPADPFQLASSTDAFFRSPHSAVSYDKRTAAPLVRRQ